MIGVHDKCYATHGREHVHDREHGRQTEEGVHAQHVHRDRALGLEMQLEVK